MRIGEIVVMPNNADVKVDLCTVSAHQLRVIGILQSISPSMKEAYLMIADVVALHAVTVDMNILVSFALESAVYVWVL